MAQIEHKLITQLIDGELQPVAPARSIPHWFVRDGVDIAGQEDGQTWGKVFSGQRSGNNVQFYVTGDEYFGKVAEAIMGARRCIFIAGWQINFDVQLTADGRTLFQYLDDALGRADVFVMPWLSPKAGVDTGDFETMLAVNLLNSRNAAHQAHCMPALAQSDMAGGLNIAFAHHQKLVVVDNKYAFVGGIDLAYGRRDNGAFRLEAGDREGNELYNSCVPPIHELTHVEKTKYLTRAELMAACFEGSAAEIAQFATSAPLKAIAVVQDSVKAVSDKVKDVQKDVNDRWNTLDIVPAFVRRLEDVPLDVLQDVSRWAYGRLDSSLQGRLSLLSETNSAHAVASATVVVAWLNGVDLTAAPPVLLEGAKKAFESLSLTAMSLLSSGAANRQKPYGNLWKLGKMAPKAFVIDAERQPRMPWHDVQCRVEGPSVYDLSMNFVRRWNGMAQRYERANANLIGRMDGIVRQIYDALGVPNKAFKAPKLARIPATLVPPKLAAAEVAKPGTSWVQVLRSAPRSMLADEAVAAQSGEVPATHAENGCLKAMLKAIHGAQDFIYIEGQFFQTAHGLESPDANAEASGPMRTMTDIRISPGYRKYAHMLGIEGVPHDQILSRMIWSRMDDVRRDLKGGGADFVNDLLEVVKGISAAELTRKIGPGQAEVLNPVGKALVQRIRRAVLDKDDYFHIYMVLPVHPEGTLNTMNVMAQMHQTMQSLVFAKDSLLNGVRRAVLVGEYMFGSRKMKLAEAEAEVSALDTNVKDNKLANAVGDRWMKYLTLLNLRNWTTLNGRPVTEQCYVHSKLLIADDRVAVLGSANINDRSMLGDRDSELAVIVTDDSEVRAPVTGQAAQPVGACVHELRKRLWKKLFGLTDGAERPASELEAILDTPAAPETWRLIQRVAMRNATRYEVAFKFLPKPGKQSEPSSIWPTWSKAFGKLDHYMPFNEQFWRDAEPRDGSFTWSAKRRAQEAAPNDINGFIVALPIAWTEGESNRSPMNLSVLAENGKTPQVTPDRSEVRTVAATASRTPPESVS